MIVFDSHNLSNLNGKTKQSSNLKIHQIIINSGKIFLGYVLYLAGGAWIFMMCERKNEVWGNIKNFFGEKYKHIQLQVWENLRISCRIFSGKKTKIYILNYSI